MKRKRDGIFIFVPGRSVELTSNRAERVIGSIATCRKASGRTRSERDIARVYSVLESKREKIKLPPGLTSYNI